MVYKSFDASGLRVSKNELSARLGVPSEELPEEVFDCAEKMKMKIEPAASAVRVSVRRISDGEICIGDAICKSAALSKVLSGCSYAVLMCATLGFGAERLLREYSLRSPSVHFMLDCAADALTETLCDRAEADFLGGAEHTARFSPGYADLPLSFTAEIIKMTGAEKLLGVKLNKSFLASPSKTVTAVIGIREDL